MKLTKCDFCFHRDSDGKCRGRLANASFYPQLDEICKKALQQYTEYLMACEETKRQVSKNQKTINIKKNTISNNIEDKKKKRGK